MRGAGWAATFLAAFLFASEARAQNFTSGTATAKKFGVHEIALTGNGAVSNPFDTRVTVTFTPPSGGAKAKVVDAFHDGGNAWRARVYVSEAGAWSWNSASPDDAGLNGKSGGFTAAASALRGRLKPHPKDARHWATDDGRWFLNLNDTAYKLFSPRDAEGKDIPFSDFTAYVQDAAAKGITSFRSTSVFQTDGSEDWEDAIFSDTAFTRFRVANFQRTDERIKWMLDNHPSLYLQFILFPRNVSWGADETFWKALTTAKREKVMRHMIARYAAFPEIFWLVINDTHYGTSFPNNNAMAREVGAFFAAHDPWTHPMATGPNRNRDYPFPGESWSTYIHLEDEHDLGAAEYAKYSSYGKPVFLGEDRYEQDHGTSRDPVTMRYWQRRLFWAWLLSGGSTNYGGRWWVLHPYGQTGSRTATSRFNSTVFTKALVGLDSVPPMSSYFSSRGIELPDFAAAHSLAQDLDGQTGARAPKLMRRGTAEYLCYHPNAAADGQSANVNSARTARVRIDLGAASGSFQVQWMRAHDGTTQAGADAAGGAARDFTAPWLGHDVVLWLKAKSAQPPVIDFVQPLQGASFAAGTNLYVKVNASDPDGSVSNVKLYLNGQFVRQENTAPYEWGAAGQNDPLLLNLAAGTYGLEAVATDNTGATGSAAVTITVGGFAVTVDYVSTGKAYGKGTAKAGALPYVDRSYAITSLSAALNGGVMIRTAMDDKYVTANPHVKLTVSHPAYIWVCYDKRGSPLPTWLNDGTWTITGEAMATTDGAASPMRVLRKSVPAGPVSLGGNQAGGRNGSAANYFAVVKPSSLAKAEEVAEFPPDVWEHAGDSDGDGLMDDFEAAQGFLDPLKADTDGDGEPDEEETAPDGQLYWDAQGAASVPAPSGDGGDGSGCGALGLEVLAILVAINLRHGRGGGLLH